MIRVGHTRKLDSLVIANDGSVFSGAIQVLNSNEVISLGSYFEVTLTQEIDSLFISAGSQSWSDGNITGTRLALRFPVVLDLETQTVCAFLYTSEGCVDSICRQIAFFPTVEVPNVFTPNSDGVNDELVLQTTSTDRIKTTIYSRWGTKVFESSVLGEYWDGTFQGRPAAPGVYFLTVEVSNPYTPSPITTTATVHLLR
jgi:gliding motility-associated-like protein